MLMTRKETIRRIRLMIKGKLSAFDELNPPDSLCINLSGMILDDCSFRNFDLRYAIFTGASLRSADFTGADLYAANFESADLAFATFHSTVANRAKFTLATLMGASFIDAKLRNAKLTNGRINANFIGANLINASFANSDLSGADLSGAILDNIHLENTYLDWSSHDLLGYILAREAITLEQKKVAALVAAGDMFRMCWGDYVRELPGPELEWGLKVLANAATPNDPNIPKIVQQYMEKESLG